MGVHRHAGRVAHYSPQPRQGSGERPVRAIRPRVWVSDILGSQRGHAVEWQVCLAHLLRDAAMPSSVATPPSVHRSSDCCCAIAIGRRRDRLMDSTLKQYPAEQDRRLDRIMAAIPLGDPGRKLRKRIAANRAHLFVFVTNRMSSRVRLHTSSLANNVVSATRIDRHGSSINAVKVGTAWPASLITAATRNRWAFPQSTVPAMRLLSVVTRSRERR
jgi:hypothetical protein